MEVGSLKIVFGSDRLSKDDKAGPKKHPV